MNADPAEQLKKISEEIQAKFDEAGMGKVEEFMDKMDGMMEQVKDGPGPLMKAVQDKAGELRDKIDKALADPSSLSPGGGGLAACASWYGGAVSTKLGAFGDEAAGVVDALTKLKADVEKPLKELADKLKDAMGKLEKGLKALAKLPKLVNSELQGKSSPEDIGKINTGPMKQALEAGDLDAPLGVLAGLKSLLESAIGVLKKGAQFLEDFLSAAPDTVKAAFDVPQPLCMLQSILLSQAPAIMTDLLGLIDKLKGASLQPLVGALDSSQETIANLDVNAVKEPVNKFTASAKDLVDKLDKTVKMAGAAGAASGAMGKLGKMFG